MRLGARARSQPALPLLKFHEPFASSAYRYWGGSQVEQARPVGSLRHSGSVAAWAVHTVVSLQADPLGQAAQHAAALQWKSFTGQHTGPGAVSMPHTLATQVAVVQTSPSSGQSAGVLQQPETGAVPHTLAVQVAVVQGLPSSAQSAAVRQHPWIGAWIQPVAPQESSVQAFRSSQPVGHVLAQLGSHSL